MTKQLGYLSVVVAIFLSVSSNIWAQHRGLAALPLLDPRYPVEDVYEVVKESPRPAINILYGTFGKSPKNLHHIIRRLVSNRRGRNHPIRIGVYVTCGPCRRPRRDGTLEHFKPRLTIGQLNRAIERRNRATERLITSFKARAATIVGWSKSWSEFDIEWRIFPELEDNLTSKARQILTNALSDEIREHPEWQIAINPLRPIKHPGIPLEVHSDSLSVARSLFRGDAISFDGIDRFPTQALVDILQARRADLLYWDRSMSDPNKPLNKRKYAIRNKEKLKALMRGQVY